MTTDSTDNKPNQQTDELSRCGWCAGDSLYQQYHDQEWGMPLFDDHKLFEFLLLEGAQAGLAWITVLRKREGYRQAFDNFDAEKIARYSDKKLLKLQQNPAIIRNRLKIDSARKNARAYLTLREQENSFSDFLWCFVDGRPQQNNWQTLQQIPATTATSDRLSKALKKRGFNFVGSTICYAFMQATGMVNDHLNSCHCHARCAQAANQR